MHAGKLNVSEVAVFFNVDVAPWQPSMLSMLKFQNPGVHLSQRLPSTFFLQWHLPETRSAAGSVFESQIPSSRDPLISQLQAVSAIIVNMQLNF